MGQRLVCSGNTTGVMARHLLQLQDHHSRAGRVPSSAWERDQECHYFPGRHPIASLSRVRQSVVFKMMITKARGPASVQAPPETWCLADAEATP